jgi:cytochrome b561-like protein
MSPTLARPLLHTVHLLLFLVLLGTGLLLYIPGLRAAVTGGYSLVIRETHLWGGVAFVVLPGWIIFRCGVRRTFNAPGPRTMRRVWQALHGAVTILLSGAFALTGFVLWGKRLLPDSLVEPSLNTHDALTYAAVILVGAHLIEVGLASFVARIKSAMPSAVQRPET